MEWIASTPTDVSTCAELFDDDESRCQCFFSIEQTLDGGVPVTAFADEFRCPATIHCAMGEPEPDYLAPGLFVQWLSTDLQDEWISDTTCPFVRCSWPNDGRWPDDDSAEEPTALGLGTPSCHTRNWMPLFCNEQEGAAFCIRTSGATDPDGLVNGHANQVPSETECTMGYLAESNKLVGGSRTDTGVRPVASCHAGPSINDVSRHPLSLSRLPFTFHISEHKVW